ncbi:unnamed protein product [Allacma fusca]|uniref:Uncharacterized protein n=1 Tax=Allacma fusca TaxID=39272 RepID=A0A8J2JWR2_9HEXA|nr:unnamed protein product [Allacma fusca]
MDVADLNAKIFNAWRKSFRVCNILPRKPQIPHEALNIKQRYLIDKVVKQCKLARDLQLQQQLKIIVFGAAGSGKSQILAHLKYELEQEKLRRDDFDYLIACFTGIAAHNVQDKRNNKCVYKPTVHWE